MKWFVVVLLFSMPSVAFRPFNHYPMEIEPSSLDTWGCMFGNNTLLGVVFKMPAILDTYPGSWNCSDTFFLINTTLPISLEGIIGKCSVSDVIEELRSVTKEEPSECGYYMTSRSVFIIEKKGWDGLNISADGSFSVWGIWIYNVDPAGVGLNGTGIFVLNDSEVYLYIFSKDKDTGLAIACEVAGCYSFFGVQVLIIISFVTACVLLFRHSRARLFRIRRLR